jgi:SAM-dependent methyltransferase
MTHSLDERYSLKTGASGADRLTLLNEIYGPSTRDFLTQSGLSEGMSVADIGCGIGTVARWIAKQVGERGRVVAIDSSSDQIEYSRNTAESKDLRSLKFRVGSAYDTGVAKSSMDIVFCRLLLAHLNNPLAAIVEMASLLKKGGVLICEEPDYSGARTYPPTDCYADAMEYMLARGVDPIIGLKLPSLCGEAGLTVKTVEVDQPAILRGSAKRYWELTVREFAPRLVELRRFAQAHMDNHLLSIHSISSDSSTLLLLPSKVQICATKTK